MKRLQHKILSMEENTQTYKAMYEGRMFVRPYQGTMAPYEDCDSTYYWEDIGYRIEQTHRLAQDKPTITISIPIKRLGITETGVAGADYCLRAFLPYIDALNEPLYNRNRPDSEKEKYYCYRPGGEAYSTILAVGGSGEYLSVADQVYLMEDYRIQNVTEGAQGGCTGSGEPDEEGAVFIRIF